MTYKNTEIRHLLKEERARGRKPPLSEKVVQRNLEKRKIVERLLGERDLSRYLKALNELGLKKGMQAYDDALSVWYECWLRDPH
jgi:hypothetical protein